VYVFQKQKAADQNCNRHPKVRVGQHAGQPVSGFAIVGELHVAVVKARCAMSRTIIGPAVNQVWSLKESVRLWGQEMAGGGGMKYRIALWASAGFLVAAGWALYAYASAAPAMTSGDPIVSLVELTCPVVFASIHFHFALGLYWSLVANAATYGLIGLIVETLRQQLHRELKLSR
jgi:hypothetical protein